MGTVYKISDKQREYVHTFELVAAASGLPLLATRLAVACSGVESSLMNWENAGTSTKISLSTGKQITQAEREVARRSLGLGDSTPPWGDNLDSMGLFAQRPSQGWGTPEQLMIPAYAVGKFYQSLVRIHNWDTLPPEVILAMVQGYPNPEIYKEWLPTAWAVV